MSELNRLTTEEFKKADKFPVSIVLDNVRSILNVGSVFRTADAFRIEKIYLCGHTPTPDKREMRKTALGGTESVNWEYYADTITAIEELKEKDYSIVAVEQTAGSIPLNEFIYKGEKIALIFGNEVKGVDQNVLDHADIVLEIPQFGTKHSLNISVSAGITLWKIVEQII